VAEANLKAAVVLVVPDNGAATNPAGNDERFAKPADGAKDVISYKDAWSTALGSRSVEACYAIIAVAWAVFGSAGKLSENTFALTAITIALVHIGLSLGVVLWVVELLSCRFSFSQKNPDKWKELWGDSANDDSPWPYTKTINRIGRVFQWAKFVLPSTAAAFLIFGLWA